VALLVFILLSICRYKKKKKKKKKKNCTDVGQAVDIDHPHSAEFLRKDCVNVNAHFGKLGLDPMSGRELFGFVTGRGFSDKSDGDDVDAELDRIMEQVALRKHGGGELRARWEGFFLFCFCV
jgi:serine/threonine-protein kinase RIO1